MISLDNLTVSYGGWTLFDNISFLINPKDRIGLVGRNGAGKTTLLRLIVGQQQPTSGAVTINGECTIGYLPQQMKVADTTTLAEETAKAFDEVLRLEAEIGRITHEIAERTDYESAAYEQLLHRLTEAQDRYHILGGETRDADIEKTLLGLGFRREDFGRATSEFSGGWRMRIELAKLLLRRPSIFLLDEPTNHLDIESIQWLEEYLRNYNGAVLLISHDRAFLDNVTTRTVELSLGRIYDYKVPYSKYVVLRAERRAQQMAAYENQQRMIEKTEEFIEKFRYKPTKSNQVQSRIKQLEKIDRIEVEEEDSAALNIKFPPAPRSGQIVAEIREAGMSFGAKHVFSGADFVIGKGDKIALVGRNGEGKTTLAKMIVGLLAPTEGSIRIGANVNIGYYAQNQEDLMNGERTVYETLDRVAVGDVRTRLRDILGAFLFRGEEIDKKVKVLSGGERSRLALASLMLEPHNLLVLDDPHAAGHGHRRRAVRSGGQPDIGIALGRRLPHLGQHSRTGDPCHGRLQHRTREGHQGHRADAHLDSRRNGAAHGRTDRRASLRRALHRGRDRGRRTERSRSHDRRDAGRQAGRQRLNGRTAENPNPYSEKACTKPPATCTPRTSRPWRNVLRQGRLSFSGDRPTTRPKGSVVDVDQVEFQVERQLQPVGELHLVIPFVAVDLDDGRIGIVLGNVLRDLLRDDRGRNRRIFAVDLFPVAVFQEFDLGAAGEDHLVGRIEELALHLGEGDLFVGEMLADELLRLFGQFADADRTIVVGTDGRGAEGEHCGSENQKLFHGVSFFK